MQNIWSAVDLLRGNPHLLSTIIFSAYVVNTKGRMLDKNWLRVISIMLQSVSSSFLYRDAATVSTLIEEMIPYGKRFGTRKFFFQHTGLID